MLQVGIDRHQYEESDDELDGFIVSEDEIVHESKPTEQEDEDVFQDRILDITTALKPNETQTQKLLKAHISVLVSALGGPDHTSNISPAPYKLGHDALACLKDIKRWIKSVDEKNQSFDVALACADSRLVTNDLIVILCQWENQQVNKQPIKNARTMEKIILSCLELLVLLTWPVEIGKELSENHKLNFSNVRKSQIIYKKEILAYNKGQTLKAVIRLVLPIFAKEKTDREPRDSAILRLVLFFIRNILYIEPANNSISSKSTKGMVSVDNIPNGVTHDDISMNVVLNAFKKNKVFVFLLTMCGSVGVEFDKEMFALPCLECIYLIIRGVDCKSLLQPSFPTKSHSQTNNGQDNDIGPIQSTVTLQLQDLLDKESYKKKVQTKNISTRHGRFGSLLSIQDSERSYVISGQEALLDNSATLNKLDQSKKWNGRSNFKYDSDEFVQTRSVFLNGTTRIILREFTEQFLVGGCFNNLIETMAWLLSGATDINYIDEYEKANYFLTVAWYFNYKRERNTFYANSPTESQKLTDDDKLDYGSVGAGLSEVNFILIISYFRESFQLKRWNSLHVAMICFREMLLISSSIFSKKQNNEKDMEEDENSQAYIDRELAEGIIRKLFSFHDFISIITQIPQTASKHSPDYLKVCISVVDIILKSFESFSNEDIKLYVQSRRKKPKNRKRVSNLDKSVEDSLRAIIDESDDEFNEERVKQVTRERKLDFNATEIKFFQTSIVSTYIDYLSRYEDLEISEIKRCISYFHRLFFVRKDFSGLYRLDFMNLIHRLRNYLPKGSEIRTTVEEFIYHFMKKFKTAFQRFPNPIEILFSRIEDLEYKTYLSTGELYIKEEPKARTNRAKLAKSLEFIREDFSLDEKFKILVTALHQQEKNSLIVWTINELERIIDLLNLNDTTIQELNPTPEYSRLLINNAYFRLLLKLVGFDLPFIMEEKCTLSPSVKQDSLIDSLNLIRKWNSSQPVIFDDDKDPFYFLRTKETNYEDDVDYEDGQAYDIDDESIAFETVPRANATLSNWSELDKLDELESNLMLVEGPKGIARKKRKVRSNVPKKNTTQKVRPESSSLHLRSNAFDILADDIAKKQEELKSSAYVRDSDDESDEERNREFFDREEKLRELLKSKGSIITPAQLNEFKKAWNNLQSTTNNVSTTESVAKAIKSTSLFLDEDDEDSDVNEVVHKTADSQENVSKSRKRRLIVSDDDDE